MLLNLKKGIIISLIFILTLTTITNVNADEDSQFLLSKFDNLADGDGENTSGFLDLHKMTGTFEASGDQYRTQYRSLKITAGTGYANLTSDFEYIGFINFSIYMNNGVADSGNIRFYDSDDHNVIELDITTDEEIRWFDGDGTPEIVYNGNPDTWYIIHITHLGTNQFNCSVYDTSMTLLGSVIDNGDYGATYSNFSYIFFDWDNTDPLGYIDNFYISTTLDGQYCDVSEYESLCMNTHNEYTSIPDGNKYIEYQSEYEYSMNIKSIILPISNDQYNLVSNDPNDYSLVVNGYVEGFADYIINFGTYYGIQWCDLGDSETGITIDNEKLLLSFASFEYYHTDADNYYWYGVGGQFGGTGLLKYHNIGYYFADDQLDGYNSDNFKLGACVYYESDINDLILSDDILSPYVDIFGNEFIQFYKYDIECQYYINDRFKIIYNLSDDNLTGGSYIQPYVYVIEKVDIQNSTSRWWTQGFIYMYQSYQSQTITVPKYITETGNYIIKLYNSSDYGNSLDTLLYTSMPIYVCKGENAGIPIQPDFDWGTGNDPSITFIIGIGIIFATIMIPLAIFRNNRFAMQNGKYLIVIFALMGMGIATITGFLDMWFIYTFTLVVCGMLGLGIYSKIKG